MTRKLRPTKSPYQIKEEQVYFFTGGHRKKSRRIQKSGRAKRKSTC